MMTQPTESPNTNNASHRVVERVTIFQLYGDFDLTQRAYLNDVFSGVYSKLAVIDFQHTGYVDSTIVNALIVAKKRINEFDGSVIVTGLPRTVQRIFDICGLFNIFESAVTIEDALQKRGLPPSLVDVIVVKSTQQ